jgi:arylsulfatase A-like enzyme
MHLFDKGWNDLREQIFANQKRLGVIPANAQLTPWPDGQPEFGGAKLPKWETLTPDEKKLFIRQADIFAAYAAYTDHEIGRVIQAVADMGKLDNTLIIYIAGDNGTSAEGSTIGTPFDMAAIEGVNIPVAEQLKYYDVWGSDKTEPHMSVAWSWAFDTRRSAGAGARRARAARHGRGAIRQTWRRIEGLVAGKPTKVVSVHTVQK